MLLESGGAVRFETRPVEGLENMLPKDLEPEKLILDGQQRLTTLTQALHLEAPVSTRTATKKPIKRHYYFDIEKAVGDAASIEEAIFAVDENRQLKDNFGRDLKLDLTTTEQECRNLCFPCDKVMQADGWETVLFDENPESMKLYMKFRTDVLTAFRNYYVPVILLKKETSKEAVCLVFEKVNTGGVQLSVFELITASYAADGYNLRDDWFGSAKRDVDSRKDRLCRNPLLKDVQATEFLQAITLLFTHERRTKDLAKGKTGKQVRPVSAKRADVLELPLQAWKDWASALESGFEHVASFLRTEALHSRRELPYSTQLVPLAAVMARIGERWREPQIRDKLARWYWSGVLGELYGGAVETRVANDYDELLIWFENDSELPRTVRDATFSPDRFDSLRTRNSAAYKGISLLVLREGSEDWFWKASIRDLEIDEVSLDIHHVFPRAWCESRGISRSRYDSILNKTPLSYKANRKIGGQAPSAYIEKLQKDKTVRLDDNSMNTILRSHALSAELLRNDDFDGFIEDRRERLGALVAKAMGKGVSRGVEN